MTDSILNLSCNQGRGQSILSSEQVVVDLQKVRLTVVTSFTSLHYYIIMSVHNKNESMMSQERGYGTEVGILRRAPISSTTHPLEESERTFQQRQEEARLSSATKAWGRGFLLHHRHQLAAANVASIGHTGFLPTSRAHLQSLTGQDLELDFTDTLGVEPEITRNPHLSFEKMQHKSLFRM
ncbi:hypothetical protein Pcinc_025778 [Petrolisthes cinctipes]|uniref:Proteasome maturation protein n=1 Tax=Petrolisthes cinctipes TaxID=88211 RepID=A0AAE1KBC6_PETCI|nr:hypothetical protein Pcinc_025778 [Petrolisthes cinctipes]